MHVVWRTQVLREPACGIVVASNDEDRDLRLPQFHHLLHEEEACAVVLPVAVVEVASKQDKGHVLVNREANEILERAPRGTSHRGNRR